MPPTKSDTKTLTWEEFAAAKQTRSRASRYLPFVLALKPRQPVNATAEFPKVKNVTLRSAILAQARKTNRKVSTLDRDGQLFVALTEAVK